MIEDILSHFRLAGSFSKGEKFGSGLINETYLCEFREGTAVRKYILQRINTSVFKQPEQVMQNIEVVTAHIVKKLRAMGMPDPYSITPALIPAQDGRSFHKEPSGAFWRVFHFIESGIVFDTAIDLNHAFEVGRGLGRFQALVSDLSPARLHDTLPGFHHTERYLAEFELALSEDPRGRTAEARREIAFVLQRQSLAPALTDLLTNGTIPIRVAHNDPKVNNIMIDKDTRRALCMLDLDTVKPGTVLFDFGDCIRSAANPAGEEATDLDTVKIDHSLFTQVAKGYLQEASFLTTEEIELLPLSVKVITFELGLRFLTDYLRGDAYFRIKHPGHNLHRARVQFRLLESIEKADLHVAL